MSSAASKTSSVSNSSQATSAAETESISASTDKTPEVSPPKEDEATKPMPKLDDEDILREVCSNNGLNFNKLPSGEGESVGILEMFFSGFPKLVGFKYFPNLHTLIVIGQTITKIEGLMHLVNLQELWLCECEIQKIENLQDLKKLKKLYLYSNQIRNIENMSALTNLEILWLNNNHIINIENLSSLSKLSELNLAENKIKMIGHSLDANINLTSINFSGNPLTSLKDITNLLRLPNLLSVSFKDPQYQPSPVSILCNYSTHILYHLPNLSRLDTYDVSSSKQLGEIAESTVSKKKMYYNMRVKTIHCNLASVITKLEKYRDQLLEFPQQKIKILVSAIKDLEKEEEIQVLTAEGNSDTESERDAKGIKENTDTKAIVDKISALQIRRKQWEDRCSELIGYCQDAVDRVNEQADSLIGRLTIELETGGNVRFEEGSPSDIWFSSCHDLVLSRFCAADYRDKGIMGIKLHRIIRIHHRMLKTRFDTKLNDLTEDKGSEDFPSTKPTTYKKHLEYLFWIWEPNSAGGLQEPNRVLEEGFSDEDTYKKLGRAPAVILSNSLSIADKPRMEFINEQNKKKTYFDSCPYKYGQVLICKAYLGRNTAVMDERPICKSSYPKIDSVIRPRKKCISVDHRMDSELMPTCECSVRQCEWYVFDNEFVLPEYIIEFEYITRLKSKSSFSNINGYLAEYKEWKMPAIIPGEELQQSPDLDVLGMGPEIKARPRLITLSEDIILKMGRAATLCSITSLNLHGNGLTKLKYIQSLTSLKRLVVSFNELTKLDDLSHMSLEYLDVSFNKIVTLDGTKGMLRLHHLDISWNKLQNTREELSMIRKHFPHLKTLYLLNNPWAKPVNLRLRVIGRLKSLIQLNSQNVSENEASCALRVAAGSRISQLALTSHSRTDQQMPRSLKLTSSPQLISLMSRLKPDIDHDASWLSKITTIVLEGQHITKLSNLEKVENLRWVSFNNNDLTKIEGLENCTKIEELSLENNCLAKLDGLSKLTNLKRIHLGHNHIVNLDTGVFNGLTQLIYLSIECNKISSLVGLQRLQSLVELYVGNNRIHNIRELFCLKPLQNLVILDCYGNPMAFDVENYRLFIIYHLKSLRALDGRAIESTEGTFAKETFGGRLTPDFVAEKLFHSNFNDVRELDLPSCCIKTVDLGRGEQFINLRSINLENNNLTSFSGLIHLVNVRVLCLNHNNIDCILPKSRSKKTVGGDFCTESHSLILQNLEVLHLGYNNIKDMSMLQLNRLPSLKALFLQGNEISKIDGMDGLHELRELVLDRNKIKGASELSFINQWNLQELHLEENRLRDLSYLSCLENLQRLYLGSNRIQDLGELEKIDNIVTLMELSLVNNAVSRRLLHRPLLIYRMPQLMVIDGIPVTDEERSKAEIYFAEQQQYIQQSPGNHGNVEGTLPGIGHYKTSVPVKVTNVQLSSPPIWNGAIMYEDPENIRGGGRRRGGGQRGELGNTGRNGTLNYQTLGSNPMYGYSVNNSSSNNNRNQYGYLQHMPQITQHTAEYMESLARLNNVRNNRR